MKTVYLLNGPNLNLLGVRDPNEYGRDTLETITKRLTESAGARGYQLKALQTNSEGTLIDVIQEARTAAAGVLLNAGALTHTSIALRDALECLTIPVIEVHCSNIFRREEFRRHSFISEVSTGVISGFRGQSYDLALQALFGLLENR